MTETGHVARHAAVHEPRAGDGRAGDHGAVGRVRARRGAVRDAHRRSAVHRLAPRRRSSRGWSPRRPRPLLPQRHTIPPHVEAAVLTALEKLPADRFATAAQFAEALTSPMADPADGERRLAAPAATRAGIRVEARDPVILGLAAAAVAALGLAAAQLRRPAAAAAAAPVRFLYTGSDSAPVGETTIPGRPRSRPTGAAGLRGRAAGRSVDALLRGAWTSSRATRFRARPAATQPLFSPDGQWIAFEADGKEQEGPARRQRAGDDRRGRRQQRRRLDDDRRAGRRRDRDTTTGSRASASPEASWRSSPGPTRPGASWTTSGRSRRRTASTVVFSVWHGALATARAGDGVARRRPGHPAGPQGHPPARGAGRRAGVRPGGRRRHGGAARRRPQAAGRQAGAGARPGAGRSPRSTAIPPCSSRGAARW